MARYDLKCRRPECLGEMTVYVLDSLHIDYKTVDCEFCEALGMDLRAYFSGDAGEIFGIQGNLEYVKKRTEILAKEKNVDDDTKH